MKVIHVDMDCFYAAIEERDNPELKGKPVAVGGRPGTRGVLTTANYEARKFGVGSAMSSSLAAKKCPNLIFVPPNFTKYKEASRIIRSIFHEYTDKVEPLSLDEAYLDVTYNEKHEGSATLLAQEIRKKIFEQTKLTASAGIAPNKFLAKVASDWKKPNGQFTVAPQQIAEFVKSLPVRKIPGVGKVTAAKMHDKGIHTCEDIQKKTKEELKLLFGKWGAALYNLSRGEDSRPVVTESVRKSLSVEHTYEADLTNEEQCLAKVPVLFEDFDRRLQKADVKDRIKGLFVKVKFHDFQQTTLESSQYKKPRIDKFQELMSAAYKREAKAVRLLGIGIRLIDEAVDIDTDQLTFEL